MNAWLEQWLRPSLLQLQPYSSARSEYKGSARIFLDANENPFDHRGLNRYPDPLQWALKQRIADWRGVAPEQIFLGNGSDEAIDLLIRLCCQPGADHIVVLPPTYGMYEVCAHISDVAVMHVPLQADFQINVEAVLAVATPQSKLLFVCSPNNPSGNAFPLAAVEALAQGFPGLVVVDEAYVDFSAQPSALSLLHRYNNLAMLQTFSKAWGLAGIRLGMAFAQPELIAWLNKIKPPYNVSQLTQEAALQALQRPARYQDEVRLILYEREHLANALTQLPVVERVFPSDANFLLVRVTNPYGLYDWLVSQGIIVRNRANVLLCEGCLRITVGTPEENQSLLQALADYRPI